VNPLVRILAFTFINTLFFSSSLLKVYVREYFIHCALQLFLPGELAILKSTPIAAAIVESSITNLALEIMVGRQRLIIM
jgi:hypothetical protein